tara:strand:- start:1468 stop:1584 length:117 start_codon:yes stop_codon:yes gene_type:complete
MVELNTLLNELQKLSKEELKKIDFEVRVALMEMEAADE